MKKIKYARIKKYNMGGDPSAALAGLSGGASPSGGAMGAVPFAQIGQIGQMYGQEMSTRADGTVDQNGYMASNALGMAGQGAQLGMMFGPYGAAIGAGVGAIGGAFMGKSQAKKINEKVRVQKRKEDEYNKALQGQIDDQKRLQQSMYNQGYYATNSMTGNAGASVYGKYGGLIPKYYGGGDNKNKPVYDNKYLNSKDIGSDYLTSNSKEGLITANAQGFKKVSGNLKSKNAIYEKDGEYYFYNEDLSNPKEPQYRLIKGGKKETKEESKETEKKLNNILKQNKPIQESNRSVVDFQYSNQGILGYTDKSKPQSTDNIYYLDNKGNMVDWSKMLPQENKPIIKENIIIQKKFGGVTPTPGGILKELSNGTKKAIGDTHEQDTNKDGQTGIMLQKRGIPYAEVENGEIIKNNKIFSNRLPFINGLTVAQEAEKLSKTIGKAENKLENTIDRRVENGSNRLIDIKNKNLNSLFNYQENLKNSLGINNELKKFAGGGFHTPTSGDVDNYMGQVTPMLDNIYNSMLIQKTPDIPLPQVREIMNASAMPLKTTIDVSKQLDDANDYYRQFNKNVDDNTSSSSTARANKLAAFSETIKNRNTTFTNKENEETRLKNQNAMNIQQVNNQNQANAQGIINSNLGLKENYFDKKLAREAQIRAEKSKNMENLTSDMMKGLKDKRSSNLDSQKMGIDSLKYSDAAGLSKQIGSENLSQALESNPEAYDLIESRLAERPEDLAKFRKMHPRK